MRLSLFIRRSPIFIQSSIGKPKNSNAFFISSSRCQSSLPSPDQITNLLQENLHAVSLNPFRFYGNLWRLAKFRMNYDKAFNLQEFQIGAKKAFAVVSRKLYDDDFEGLHGLISEETLNRLRPAVQSLSDQQKDILDIQESDIYGQFMFSCLFQKNVSGDDFFEILIAHHCFRGMDDYRKENPNAESLQQLFKNKDRFILANIKFAKRLTPVLDSDWTITYLNYARTEASSGGWGRFKPPSN